VVEEEGRERRGLTGSLHASSQTSFPVQGGIRMWFELEKDVRSGEWRERASPERV
jgi:hypothetical protein